MRKLCLLLIIFITAGCAIDSVNTVQKGTSVKRVVELYGVPDVIAERSGDLMRYYKGDDTPKYTWPDTSKKKYYYLQSETMLVFESNKVVSINPINQDENQIVQQMLLNSQ